MTDDELADELESLQLFLRNWDWDAMEDNEFPENYDLALTRAQEKMR